MEEHQAARNDLASLLASTDIAVLFLDTQFRIRRFTPAMKDLLEMIQTDLGRPLSDLAKKFSDPELVRDCENVLERLLPVEREVEANGNRWYMRRVLPYRTVDNRIDGVVITFVDITHRKQSEAERVELLKREREARVEAESANRTKDEFLATVSHELRTPLSAILLWAKVLLDEPGQTPQIHEGIAAINSSAESQRTLIDDLLDTSRIISGTLRLQTQKVDLKTLMRNTVEMVLPMAQAKRVEIRTDFSKDGNIVGADDERLRQIVWNLLTNAVKFTPAGGSVEVVLRRSGGEIEIQVSDTGIGITAEFLPHVFDRFQQADSSTTRRQSGLGLGLAITKQLVTLHHGTIEAHSPGRDKGSTFIVRLPLPLISADVGATPKIAPTGRSSLDFNRAKVLVLEDDLDSRTGLVALLRNANAVPTAVGSAAAALQAVEKLPPDLIISDIGLPNEDGYSFIRRLRTWESSKSRPQIPAIALTAFARPQDLKRALDAGFQAHVAKPLDANQFFSAAHELLARKNA
jgi:signal transduction histidine kinase/ActR/RegA family two-component response regulator